MAYQSEDDYTTSNIAEEKKAEKRRSDANNAKNISNAADVAIASGEGHAVAIGTAVKGLDKATGGLSTKALGKTLTNVNRIAPGGRHIQNMSNKLSESGASDAIGKAASMKNGMSGGGVNTPSNPAGNDAISGGGQSSSLPSSNSKALGDTSDSDNKRKIAGVDSTPKHSILDDDINNNDDKKDKKTDGFGNFTISLPAKIALFAMIPAFLFFIILFIVIASFTGIFSDFDDAFGISQTIGEETGDLYFQSSNPEQQAFYDRVNNVKLKYQAIGRVVDPLKIVAVYHVLNVNGANLDYSDMSEWEIMSFADAMFDGNTYNEEVFKNNLIKNVIPKYLPNTLDGERKQMAQDVFDYIDRYYALIGKNKNSSSCASSGNCAYDIKGFYISGRGNVAKSMQISNLKVRLMECGGKYGNGSYTTPINQDLVDFEEYVAGVAYAEIGAETAAEAVKAQLVAARSFALSRPTAMGNSLGKKLEEENGQWILQISSCVADQVFCNINEGCSYMGGGDGQGGIVRSGNVAGAVKYRPPLAENHPLRTYMKETEGEVLVNAQGYIIAAGFLSTEQNQFMKLARQGLNYKQILLQVYNQGSRNYQASDIQKASCSGSSSSNCGGLSTGEFASWKQFGAPWSGVAMGGSNIGRVGCLITSIAIQIAKSGVPTILDDFNPGTFVQYLNSHGAFGGGGGLSSFASPTTVAPTFVYQSQFYLAGKSRAEKLSVIRSYADQHDLYVVCEVKGNTGQHWVAIDSVAGDTINMMDPGSNSTDMWAQYNWANTSRCIYYKAG